MKYRPSVSFLLCLLGIAVVEVEVIRTMVRGKPALENVPADQATLDYLGKRKQPYKYVTDKDYAATVTANFAAGEEAKRKLLEKFPILAFKDGATPDKRNAYDPIRRNRELERLLGRSKPFPDTPNRPLATLSSFQEPAAFRALLEDPEYGGLMAKIERLATLSPPSSVEEARERFEGLSQWSGKHCIGALLKKAWLAAEAKDETEALRMVESAIRLSSHFDLLGEPYELPDRPASREFIQERSLSPIIRSLGRGADLPRWRETLASIPNPKRSAWAADLREGWHRRADRLIEQSVDPIKAARARTNLSELRRYSKRSERLIALVEGGEEYPLVKQLNTAEFYFESRVHARNLARRVGILAAIDLLILEKSGVTLDASSMDRISTGMHPGEIPRFDPATRRILFPMSVQAVINLDPLTIPGICPKERRTSGAPEGEE